MNREVDTMNDGKDGLGGSSSTTPIPTPVIPTKSYTSKKSKIITGVLIAIVVIGAFLAL